jgi:phytoene dehydrogenase-like protein
MEKQKSRKVVIIGGGIAGLCAAVYAQRCGYEALVLEMHDMAGGLAMSWQRGPYTFETCLHWLFGSNPGDAMYGQWREVFDIEKLTFVDPVEFVRMETEEGDGLSLWTNAERLEAELLKHAPQDARAIRRFIGEVRKLGRFKMPDPAKGWLANGGTLLQDATCLLLLRRLTRMTGREYGAQFTDPLVKAFFGMGEMGKLSALALVFSLAGMNVRNAGYCHGGSQAIIRLIEERLASLGGRVRFGAKVERILVKNGAAVGVELTGGETIAADWVISAADGYSTIYKMLDGKYTSKAVNNIYESLEPFPSYLQVSLGVAMDLTAQPGNLARLLSTPLDVDPGTQVEQLSFRIFNFDPAFAPPGCTAVTCLILTRNTEYWVNLRNNDLTRYRAEKARIAEAVIGALEKRIPGLRQAIQVTDVATPASVVRYTGNWKGSMEGWLLTPKTGVRQLQVTLPGLRQFRMVGQWVMPGGGLPSGLMTARTAIQAICRQDHVPFKPSA